jgi:hypothetical protein
VHVNPSKLSSGSVLALFTALLFLAHSGTTDAQSTSRSFQTGLYVDLSEPNLTKADADIAMFGEGQPQPPGRSIMKFKSYSYATPILATEGYDWSRIVAALIDEPYMSALQVAFPGTNQDKNPCHDAPGPRIDVIYSTQQQLAAAASALASVAPYARLWVNFTTHEVDWMAETACSLTLNQPNIDVISVDEYYDVFDPAVKSRYAWFVAHRATPQQQLALIPGTFYRPGQDDPGRQAGLFQGYFDYADNANQSCNLPLGPRGVTGSFDGCPVWMVLGFAADTFVQDGTTYVGELDPRNAAVISAVWRAELALPVRPGLSLELTRQQIVSTLMRQWLTN